jgi:hypothetical protein
LQTTATVRALCPAVARNNGKTTLQVRNIDDENCIDLTTGDQRSCTSHQDRNLSQCSHNRANRPNSSSSTVFTTCSSTATQPFLLIPFAQRFSYYRRTYCCKRRLNWPSDRKDITVVSCWYKLPDSSLALTYLVGFRIGPSR